MALSQIFSNICENCPVAPSYGFTDMVDSSVRRAKVRRALKRHAIGQYLIL